MDICKGCGEPKTIVNKFHGLCRECNNIRLHGSPYGKQKPKIVAKRISRDDFVSVLNKKAIQRIRKDEETYQEVFNSSNHRCEECFCLLNTQFRNDDGKVIFKTRYSHILPKSVYPKLRNNPNNFNNLCLEHHDQWEHGDRKRMRIYKKNHKKCLELWKIDISLLRN